MEESDWYDSEEEASEKRPIRKVKREETIVQWGTFKPTGDAELD